jgi:hypothetical protein
MNRFVRAVVSSASVLVGLAAASSPAQAQIAYTAPPAYTAPAPPQPYWNRNSSNYGYRGSNRAYDARSERQHDRAGVRWDRRDWRHMRECERAYESGAPYWVLERMRCPTY